MAGAGVGSRQQDPATTTPRPASVAEQRARREAQRRERAQAEAAEHRRSVRKRVLVGGGVAVGLVAVVAIAYAASQPDEGDEVSAQCTDQNGVVVEDRFCSGNQVPGSYGGTFVPIFLGGFGNQYHYTYGSNAAVGSRVSGGSLSAPPAGTSLRGSSGAGVGSSTSSGTVSRGGLGVSGTSSSGSSSGSSGS